MTQTNTNPFRKAEKERTHLRMALYGASGSGKTLTALYIAQGLGGKIAVIDTEHGNASIYGDRVDFDVLELNEYHPQRYIDAINAAANAGYSVLIIDSLSHAWFGTGGLLEIVDKAAAKSDSKNTYAAWRFATPLQNKLVEAIIAAPMHLICTMRSKTDYVLEPNRNGKMEPRKVGTAPIQRDGLEYEFRIVAKMNAEHQLSIDKTHYPELDGDVINTPTPSFGERLKSIIAEGAEPKPREVPREPEPTPASVRGAGVQPRPVAAPAPQQPDPFEDFGAENGATTTVIANRPDDDLNLYHAVKLAVGGSRTRKTYEAWTESNVPIPLKVEHVQGKMIEGEAITAMTPGVRDLNPSWSIYADKDADGWHISKIETGIPVSGVSE